MASTQTNKGLRQLNVGIVLMLSASATAGYNASQINSLLVLPECESLEPAEIHDFNTN